MKNLEMLYSSIPLYNACVEWPSKIKTWDIRKCNISEGIKQINKGDDLYKILMTKVYSVTHNTVLFIKLRIDN